MFVELDEDIHGLAHISQLNLAPGERINEAYKAGETHEFEIVSIEPKEHRLGLAVTKKKPAKSEAKAAEIKAGEKTEAKKEDEPSKKTEKAAETAKAKKTEKVSVKKPEKKSDTKKKTDEKKTVKKTTTAPDKKKVSAKAK